ncbi:MAG: tRNA guanosine(34) transglycosylase Tgt [Candidatus Fonsibacter sp.]
MATSFFSLIEEDHFARLGKIITTRGVIDTPAFMPVGTAGTVKAMFIDDVKNVGAQIILANTYHLMIRPGIERIIQAGGLHKFMNCSLPILTDSGGFQVMSLSKISKIKDDGVIFNSHLDGKEFFLTPEKSVQIQLGLGSDLIMVFDDCPKYSNDKKKIEKSMNLTIDWAKKSKKNFGKQKKNWLFGIVQGGIFPDLRIQCLNRLIDIDFDGFALGGLAVGEKQSEMFEAIDSVSEYLPKNKPHYLMGSGTPQDILGAVKRGIDMFDCVMPTRSGRTGLAFTWKGKINIRNAKYSKDETPLDEEVDCFASKNYSKNYLNHLVNSNEILGSMLLTMHNIAFYQDLMKKIRLSIKEKRFNEFYKKYYEVLGS